MSDLPWFYQLEPTWTTTLSACVFLLPFFVAFYAFSISAHGLPTSLMKVGEARISAGAQVAPTWSSAGETSSCGTLKL